MADDDNFLIKTLNFFSPTNLVDSIIGAATGKSDDLKSVQDPSFNQRLGSFANNSQLVSGVGTGIKTAENIPVVGAPIKFTLDFGNRTADSLFTAAQYADYMNANGDGSFGNFFDGWRKGWDTWGQEGHVTAGQVIGASLTDSFDPTVQAGTIGQLNPFTAQGAHGLDALAKKNWYSDVAGGASDLAAGFISPGTLVGGAVKASRAAGHLDILAKVESAESAFNTASKAGKLDDLKAGRGQAFVKSLVGSPIGGETYAAMLRDGARETYHASGDMTSAMNFLAPRMGHASDNAKRVLAETAVYARNLPEDMGTHVIGNTWLALLGSEKAANEVISAAPLVMEKIANATGAPVELATVAKAQEKLLAAHRAGQEVRLDSIMEETFNTPQKRLVHDALKSDLERAAQDAAQLKDIRARVIAMRPTMKASGFRGKVDHLDVALLKESRAKAITQHDSLRTELRSAKERLATVRSEGGDLTDIEARVKGLEDDLAQARADRDLLNSTPLHDQAKFQQFRDSLNAVKGSQKTAARKADFISALERTARRELRDDVSRMKEIRPSLDATNLWLTDVMSIGNEAATGSIMATRLDKAKTGFRNWVGRSYMYDSGDYSPKTFFHVHPTEWVANIGTSYGRRAVNMHDLYKGQQELGMYLKKSGQYTGDEIRALTNEFLSAGPSKAGAVIERIGDDMAERMLTASGNFHPLQVKEAIRTMRLTSHQVRSYLTGRLAESEANGDRWVRTNELPVTAEASTANHMIDSPVLRSHLGDTVAFPDPSDIERFIHLHGKSLSAQRVVDNVAGAVDIYQHWWKAFNLVRPGLFFRNMMDTGLRAQMMIGSMAYAASAMQGSIHQIRNTGIKVGDWATRSSKGQPLERIGLRSGPSDTAKSVLGDSGVKVDIGDGQKQSMSLYETHNGHALASSITAIRGAATRGASVGENIMSTSLPIHKQLMRETAAWDKLKATDPRWEGAYADHAQALVASPTVRKMIEQRDLPGEHDISGPERMRELFSDPAVREEYQRLAAERNMTREEYVEQLDWELDNMFPEPGMAKDVMAGKLKGVRGTRWFQEHFPVEQRFDLPGRNAESPHGLSPSALTRYTTEKWLNKFFRVVVDEPDFWLVRHPVMVKSYADQVKREASTLIAARKAKFGDDAVLSERDIATIDKRSRNHAVGVVKDYMYDATYNNANSVLHRIAPFFNPWYDAMRSYSKLIYDDPARLSKITGLWNAPTNISQWLPEPLVVDINGNEVRTGEEPTQGNGERLFVLSSLIGQKSKAGEGLKLRQSSFNTILMGQVPWLPGWGPVATVPLAATINTDQDLALWLSQRDDPVLGTLMKSLWPEGQISASDLESLWESQKPATWRKTQDWLGKGKTYWTNVQYGMNQAYLKALQNGEPFDPVKARVEAEREASKAGLLSVISQGVFGLSAKSDVAGQFYVDEMRQIMTLPPETIRAKGFPSAQAMFSAMHPEAKDLTWTFTRNETGINATAVAQDRANDLRPMIDKIPDMGWFIVGDQNVGGEFSQTAYNQQKQFTYGITQEGRKVLDSGEVMGNTLAGIGWDQYLKTAMMIEDYGTQYGFKPDAIASVKAQYAQMLGQQNPQWFEDYNTRENKLADFLNKADIIAQDPSMASRQDIGMYVEYRAAQQQVMSMLGLQSLNGTGAKSLQAKAILLQIGSQMAAQNLGFQQMWERVLYNQVKPRGMTNVDAAPAA